MKKRDNKGFSLIELIIAIAILVILTGLLAPQFMRYMEKSREAKDMQTLDTFYSSVQIALSGEKSYSEFTSDEAFKDLKEGGMSLENFLKLPAASEFGREFRATFGSASAGDPLTLWASGAVITAGGNKAVYAQVDADMKITAWIGKPAVKDKDKYPVIEKKNVLQNTAGTSFIIAR